MALRLRNRYFELVGTLPDLRFRKDCPKLGRPSDADPGSDRRSQ
jgi:hypothetical protein